MNQSVVLQAERFAKKYVRPAEGRTLIVGSYLTDENKKDRRQAFVDAVGVDMRAGPGVDVVANLEEDARALGKFHHIECWSVLEHSRRPWRLAKNLEGLLVVGGTLHVQVPFVWRYHDYPGDLWRFTHEGVRELFPRIEWAALMYASNGLRPDHYLPALDDGQHPYLPRTEVCGFGFRR